MVTDIAIQKLLDEKDAHISGLEERLLAVIQDGVAQSGIALTYAEQLDNMAHDLALAHSALEEEREQRRELERSNREISRRLRDYADSLSEIAGRL